MACTTVLGAQSPVESLVQVIALMREIGCIVKSAKDQNGAPGFDAKLLPATSTSGTLADALPKIKQRAGPRK